MLYSRVVPDLSESFDSRFLQMGYWGRSTAPNFLAIWQAQASQDDFKQLLSIVNPLLPAIKKSGLS
jgi:hypothetical protein